MHSLNVHAMDRSRVRTGGPDTPTHPGAGKSQVAIWFLIKSDTLKIYFLKRRYQSVQVKLKPQKCNYYAVQMPNYTVIPLWAYNTYAL